MEVVSNGLVVLFCPFANPGCGEERVFVLGRRYQTDGSDGLGEVGISDSSYPFLAD